LHDGGGLQLCSDSGRPSPANLLALSDSKQSLGLATGAPASGGYGKYHGRWTSHEAARAIPV